MSIEFTEPGQLNTHRVIPAISNFNYNSITHPADDQSKQEGQSKKMPSHLNDSHLVTKSSHNLISSLNKLEEM